MDCPVVSQLENVTKQMKETPAMVNDYLHLMPEIIKTLKSITGIEYQSYKEYQKWWNKVYDKFEVDDSEKEENQDKKGDQENKDIKEGGGG